MSDTEENFFEAVKENARLHGRIATLQRANVELAERLKKQEAANKEFGLFSVMTQLLNELYEYANDGDAGPGTPTLPRRDIRLRSAVNKMQENLGIR